MFASRSQRRQAVLLALFAAVGFTAVLKIQDVRAGSPGATEATELKLFQGSWNFIKGSKDGLDLPEEFLKEVKMTFTGNLLALHVLGLDKKASIKIDASKTPKHIDLQFDAGDEAGYGIYLFEGDSVKIHAAEKKDDRPKDFKADAPLVIVLKKAAPETDAKKTDKKLVRPQASLVALAVELQGKSDKDQLQGTWSVASAVKGGEQMPPDKAATIKLTFKGDEVITQSGPEAAKKPGSFKLDERAKPRQIDLTIDGKTGAGIYEIDGDTVRLCFADPDSKATRPTEFKADAGTPHMLMVLRRDKADKKSPRSRAFLTSIQDTPKAKTDNELIQGTWKPTDFRFGDQKLTDDIKDLLNEIRIKITDGKVSFVILEQSMEGTFKLDPTKSPKQIDLTMEDAKVEGIYELKEDKIRICGAEPGKTRPTTFTGDANIIFEMERVEPAKTGGKSDFFASRAMTR